MVILYVVYEVRLLILYLFTFRVVILRIKELASFSLIQQRERPYAPRFLGSSQDISALVDVMLVTVRFVGFSGNAASGKSTKTNFEICSK
jgi:hypothetical protein